MKIDMRGLLILCNEGILNLCMSNGLSVSPCLLQW